jgi:1-aminocyclopropane-1-carboxylate deaminase/D-cysteine desulfhydrase-like pyridoxal-dependent ACC family enzyme
VGFFGKILGAAVDIVLTPIEIVKDVATMGGVLTDNDETYTGKRLEKAIDKISDSADDAANGKIL